MRKVRGGGGLVMRKIINHSYSSLISLNNLFQAWEEFKKGKRDKRDVQILERYLEDNIFDLHCKLKNKTYRHSPYKEFWVNDPKRRHIHKAQVNDRIVHHLLYKYLYRLYDKSFIFDSYSCRVNKGTHRAVKRLETFARIVSCNYTRECWALKLDIKKFFASIDHNFLKGLVHKSIKDKNINQLIDKVIDSFHSEADVGKGIPLGNLTSQIFANIYLNELDQFIKHKLKIKYYLRYADDFVILDSDRKHLNTYIDSINGFVQNNLKLELHPGKIVVCRFKWGIDFCGYIVLPHYILPRTKTKIRILKKVSKIQINEQGLQSYLGYFSHANAYKIELEVQNINFLNSRS